LCVFFWNLNANSGKPETSQSAVASSLSFSFASVLPQLCRWQSAKLCAGFQFGACRIQIEGRGLKKRDSLDATSFVCLPAVFIRRSLRRGSQRQCAFRSTGANGTDSFEKSPFRKPTLN